MGVECGWFWSIKSIRYYFAVCLVYFASGCVCVCVRCSSFSVCVVWYTLMFNLLFIFEVFFTSPLSLTPQKCRKWRDLWFNFIGFTFFNQSIHDKLLKSCLLTEDFKVKYYKATVCSVVYFWYFGAPYSSVEFTVKQSALLAQFHTRLINLHQKTGFGGAWDRNRRHLPNYYALFR